MTGQLETKKVALYEVEKILPFTSNYNTVSLDRGLRLRPAASRRFCLASTELASAKC